MYKFIKNLPLRFGVIGAALFLQLIIVALPARVIYADTNSESCARLQKQFQQLDTPAGSMATKPTDVTGQFTTKYCTVAAVVSGATNILFGLSGAAAVLFIIIGGFWFMTSAGNQEQAEKGKKTLIYAVIGLIIVVLATTIVRIVVNLLIT